MGAQARPVIHFPMTVLVVVLAAMSAAEGAYYRCNLATYGDNDHYAASVAYVLQDLLAETPTRQGYAYRNRAPYFDAPCYGRATCASSLKADRCASCLDDVAKLIADNCGKKIGAEGDLDSCSIRYEPVLF